MTGPDVPPRTLLCQVCEKAWRVPFEDAGEPPRQHHCADCGTLLRAAPTSWAEGEVGVDTAEVLRVASEVEDEPDA